MKKVLLLVALMAAFVLTGCNNNGVSKLPEDLRTTVEIMDEMYSTVFGKMDIVDYKGVKVEDHDIVFTLKFGREATQGESLYSMSQELKESAIGNMGTGAAAVRDLLQESGYTLVFRLKCEGEVEDARISYSDIPSYY